MGAQTWIIIFILRYYFVCISSTKVPASQSASQRSASFLHSNSSKEFLVYSWRKYRPQDGFQETKTPDKTDQDHETSLPAQPAMHLTRRTRPNEHRVHPTRSYGHRVHTIRPYEHRVHTTRPYENRVQAMRLFDHRLHTARPYEHQVQTTRSYENRVNITRPDENRVHTTTPYENRVQTIKPYENRVHTTILYENRVHTTRPYENRAQITRSYENRAQTSRPYEHRVHTERPYEHRVHTERPYEHRVHTERPYEHRVHTERPYEHRVHTERPYEHRVHTERPYEHRVHTAGQNKEQIKNKYSADTTQENKETLQNENSIFTTSGKIMEQTVKQNEMSPHTKLQNEDLAHTKWENKEVVHTTNDHENLSQMRNENKNQTYKTKQNEYWRLTTIRSEANIQNLESNTLKHTTITSVDLSPEKVQQQILVNSVTNKKEVAFSEPQSGKLRQTTKHGSISLPEANTTESTSSQPPPEIVQKEMKSNHFHQYSDKESASEQDKSESSRTTNMDYSVFDISAVTNISGVNSHNANNATSHPVSSRNITGNMTSEDRTNIPVTQNNADLGITKTSMAKKNTEHGITNNSMLHSITEQNTTKSSVADYGAKNGARNNSVVDKITDKRVIFNSANTEKKIKQSIINRSITENMNESDSKKNSVIENTTKRGVTNSSANENVTEQSVTGSHVTLSYAGSGVTNSSAGRYTTNSFAENYVTNSSAGIYVTNSSVGRSVTNSSVGRSVTNSSAGRYTTNSYMGRSVTNSSAESYVTNSYMGRSVTNNYEGRSVTIISEGRSVTNSSAGSYVTNNSAGSYVTNSYMGRNVTIISEERNVTNSYEGRSVTRSSTGRRVTNNSDGKSVTNNSEGKSVTNNSEGKSVTNNFEGKSITNNSEGKSVTNNSEGKSVTNNSEGKNVTNSSEGKSITNTSEGKSITNNSKGKSITNNSEGKSITNNSEGKSITNKSEGRSVTNSSEGKSITNNSEGKSITNNSEGKSVTNKSEGKSVTNNSGDKSITKNSEGKSVTNNSEGKSVTNISHGKSITNNSAGKSVTNNSEGKNVTNPYAEWKVTNSYNAKNKTTASEINNFVTENITRENITNSFVADIITDKKITSSYITKNTTGENVTHPFAAETTVGKMTKNNTATENRPDDSTENTAVTVIITGNITATFAAKETTTKQNTAGGNKAISHEWTRESGDHYEKTSSVVTDSFKTAYDLTRSGHETSGYFTTVSKFINNVTMSNFETQNNLTNGDFEAVNNWKGLDAYTTNSLTKQHFDATNSFTLSDFDTTDNLAASDFDVTVNLTKPNFDTTDHLATPDIATTNNLTRPDSDTTDRTPSYNLPQQDEEEEEEEEEGDIYFSRALLNRPTVPDLPDVHETGSLPAHQPENEENTTDITDKDSTEERLKTGSSDRDDEHHLRTSESLHQKTVSEVSDSNEKQSAIEDKMLQESTTSSPVNWRHSTRYTNRPTYSQSTEEEYYLLTSKDDARHTELEENDRHLSTRLVNEDDTRSMPSIVETTSEGNKDVPQNDHEAETRPEDGRSSPGSYEGTHVTPTKDRKNNTKENAGHSSKGRTTPTDSFTTEHACLGCRETTSPPLATGRLTLTTQTMATSRNMNQWSTSSSDATTFLPQPSSPSSSLPSMMSTLTSAKLSVESHRPPTQHKLLSALSISNTVSKLSSRPSLVTTTTEKTSFSLHEKATDATAATMFHTRTSKSTTLNPVSATLKPVSATLKPVSVQTAPPQKDTANLTFSTTQPSQQEPQLQTDDIPQPATMVTTRDARNLATSTTTEASNLATSSFRRTQTVVHTSATVSKTRAVPTTSTKVNTQTTMINTSAATTAIFSTSRTTVQSSPVPPRFLANTTGSFKGTSRSSTETSTLTTKATKATKQVELTTSTSTTTSTPSPPQLNDPCTRSHDPNDDPCRVHIAFSSCEKGTCRCIWPRHAHNHTCTEYLLPDPHLRITNVSETKLTVTWSEVAFTDLQAIRYRITWQDSNDAHTGSVLKSSTNVHTLERLSPGTEYTIRVAAILTAPSNELREHELHFLQITRRTVPSQVKNMKWSWCCDETRLTLTFDPPEGLYSHCIIMVHKMTSAGHVESSVGPKKFECQTFDISPPELGVWHKAEVTAVSGKFSGMISVFNFTVPVTAPSAVTELTWGFSSHAISLTWGPPLKPRGYITGYDVKLYSNGACIKHVLVWASAEQTRRGWKTSQVSEVPQGPSLCPLMESVFPTTGFGRHFKYSFTDLQPGSEYIAQIFAQSTDLQGEITNVTVTTSSAVPDPPRSPRSEAINSSHILVTWKPPEYPGPTDYVIQVLQSRSKLKTITIRGYNMTRCVINGLNCYSTYWFNISAVTSAGGSEPVMAGPVTTMEDVSDAVTNLKVTGTTSRSVTLVWGHPRNVNGRLIAYVIFIQSEKSPGKCDQIITLSGKQSVTQINQSFCNHGRNIQASIKATNHSTLISYSVTDLQPYTPYNISIAPYNGAGVGQITEIRVTTSISVPAAPSGQKCTYPGQGMIQFSWDAPTVRAGPTSYNILVWQSKNMDDLSLGSDVIQNFTVPESGNRSLVLSGLRDYWLYSFTMWAFTQAGNSGSVNMTIPCRTLSAAPGLVRSFDIVTHNVSSARVMWECPIDENRHGVISEFLLHQRPSILNRNDLDRESLLDLTFRVDAGIRPCSKVYYLSVSVVPEVTYIFQVQAKVAEIDQPGESRTQVFTAPAHVPAPIVALPTSEPYRGESFLRESGFSVSICVYCLRSNSHGQVLAFGILVCQEGFCDEDLGDLKDWKTLYLNLPTWKAAQSSRFEILYRATNSSWESELQTGQGKNDASVVTFEIGSDASCMDMPENVYCNGPVPPGKSFRVRLFSCTNAGCTVSEPSGLFMTAESSSQSSSDAVVIGGAAAGASIAIIVVLIVIAVRLRFKLMKWAAKKKSDKEKQEMSQVISLTDIPENINRKQYRPVKIGEFEEVLRTLHVKDDALLSQEYAELNAQTQQHSMDVGSDFEYRHDNRWTNILPYDHSRVKLTTKVGDDDYVHDYINANYISGLYSDHDYIATQGPLSRTVPNFWRMVWEQNVSVIVMLSDFEEMDKRTQMMREKVARYFPEMNDSNPSQYGLIQVTTTAKVDAKVWEVRTIKLSHVQNKKIRVIKHYFFKRWSDHEADIDPRDLISFVEALIQETGLRPQAPLVVHCSAGVGRTGTFIAVDYFYKLLTRRKQVTHKQGPTAQQNQTVDIFGRVLEMRDSRRFMVQTMAQYIFIYDTVQEVIQQLFGWKKSKEEIRLSHGGISLTAAMEDAVYDDVDQLKGQVSADKAF